MLSFSPGFNRVIDLFSDVRTISRFLIRWGEGKPLKRLRGIKTPCHRLKPGENERRPTNSLLKWILARG